MNSKTENNINSKTENNINSKTEKNKYYPLITRKIKRKCSSPIVRPSRPHNEYISMRCHYSLWL